MDVRCCEISDIWGIEWNPSVVLDVCHDLPGGFLLQVAGLQVLGKQLHLGTHGKNLAEVQSAECSNHCGGTNLIKHLSTT